MAHPNFRKMLKYLDDSLGSDDLAVFKFLCRDIITTSKMDNIKCSLDLFDELENAEAIGTDNLQLLAELLFEAQRIDLMKATGTSQDDLRCLIQDNGHILDPYRRMLHQLSEHMISSDVKQLKRIMRETVQRSRLDEASDAYSLFTLLEKLQIIASRNVRQLLGFTRQMDEKGLTAIVQAYQDEFCEKLEATREISTQCDCEPVSVPPRTSLQIPEYDVKTKGVKGLCVVINNEKFVPLKQHRACKEELAGPRNGSSIDADALEKIFTQLRFEVKVFRNLTSDQLRHSMKQLARKDHSRYDIFICCILTHGEAGQVFGTDCVPVSIHSILARFTPKQCKTLENKPKVFFVQACQGSRLEDESLESIPYADGVPDLEVDDLEVDFAGKLSNVTNLPRQPDYLLGLATVPGFVSYRSKSSGSWYIQALCELLSIYHNHTDLLSILTEVNNKVIKKEQKAGAIQAIQMPSPQHTLRKRIYLKTS